MFRCIKCKRVVPTLEERIRCPYCGFRIFVKCKPETVKRVRAR